MYAKKDSTGICFIGERPFRDFLANYLPARPGRIETPGGEDMGEHNGLMYYTLGQRQGLGIGGRNDRGGAPWYVVAKIVEDNVLVVAQGDHELLYSRSLKASSTAWIGSPPDGLQSGLRTMAKVRYRQEDQPCRVQERGSDGLEVVFDEPQKAVAPGQYVVFYNRDRCLGGAVIDQIA